MFSRGETFWKKFLPGPLFKNFQTKWINRVECSSGIPNRLYDVQKLRTSDMHLLSSPNSLKFFGRGSGKPFCKKVSPIKILFTKEKKHGKKD